MDTSIHPIHLMIVGAQKAGTSSLLRYLGQHPGICTHRQREMPYFTSDLEYMQGYPRAYQRYFQCEQVEKSVLLAKSAGLMYSSEAVKRVHDHNPDIHLVISLRHPVDRAYSDYWHARRRGLEDLETFEAAIEADPRRFGDDVLRQHRCAYLEKSKYVKYLIGLQEHFSQEQIHVFLLEDIERDLAGTCRTLYLLYDELDPAYVPREARRYNVASQSRFQSLARLTWSRETARTFKRMLRWILPDRVVDTTRETIRRINEKAFIPPPINPKTQKELIDYFQPFNAQLSELLERDLGHWDVPDKDRVNPVHR